MPSANTASQVYFAPKARVLIADVTAATGKLPIDVATDLDPIWLELGYVDDTGIELTPVINTNPVAAMQSASPIKYVVKDASIGLKFTMLQFTASTVELYFGRKWTTTSAVQTLVLDSTPTILEKALIVEWGDFTQTSPVSPAVPVVTGNKNRLVIPRGMVATKDVIKLERSGVMTLGITYEALDINGTLGTLITNAA